MDEQNQNTVGEGLTVEQQELLAQFATRRAARLAVASGRTPELSALETRLKEMDAAFATSPDRDNSLAQENHELKRYTAILEETIRAFWAGELVAHGGQ